MIDDNIKEFFFSNGWNIQHVTATEKIISGVDFKVHGRNKKQSYEMVHDGFGFGDRNGVGESI